MQYDHAVPLLVSIDQQICPVPVDADENHFFWRHRTSDQLVGVAGSEHLHIHRSTIMKVAKQI